MAKSSKPTKVYTLLVQVGRCDGDGLPEDSTGAGLLCFSSGKSEDEAVHETVAVLKTAEMAPLDVTGYGDEEERLAQGHEISADERDLMERAREENAVIVVQVTPFYGEEDISSLH